MTGIVLLKADSQLDMAQFAVQVETRSRIQIRQMCPLKIWCNSRRRVKRQAVKKRCC